MLESQGLLSLVGNYRLSGTGELDVGLGGAGTDQYSQLQIAGNAALAGTFVAVYLNNYMAGPELKFVVLSFDSYPGHFDSYGLPPLNGAYWYVSYSQFTFLIGTHAIPLI